MPHTVKTVIIDDETLVASMLERCLSRVPVLRVVGAAACGASGLELCLKCKPDLVLLDLEMPRMSGLEVARQLREQLPKTRIIVVSSHCEPYAVYELNRLRVHGFVDKGSPLKLLLSIVQEVVAGRYAYCPRFQDVLRDLRQQAEAFQKILSLREIAVLRLVVDGQGDADIGRELGIAPETVSTHRRNIRSKVNAHNDRELTNYARQWGLVPLTIGGTMSSGRGL